MHPSLEKIRRQTEKAGPAVTELPITIGDSTETYRFRRIAYQRAKEISSLPMDVIPASEDGPKDANGNPTISVVINPAKVATRDTTLIFESLVDDDSKPFLTMEEIAALPPDLGQKLFEAAAKANGMNDGAVADATKNSKATASADTSSVSPTDAAAPSQS
jgi:hypothetical protein